MSRLASSSLLFASVLACAPGCKPGGGRAKPTASSAPEPEEPSFASPVPLRALATAGDGGSVTVGAMLPADFPKEVPVYEGGRVVFAAKSTNASGRPGWTVTLETGDAKDRVVDYYKAHMPGFKLATSMDLGDTSMSVWQGPTYDATLMATVEGDQTTTVTLTVGGR